MIEIGLVLSAKIDRDSSAAAKLDFDRIFFLRTGHKDQCEGTGSSLPELMLPDSHGNRLRKSCR